MDLKNELLLREAEEKELVFEHFSNEDALALGLEVLRLAKERGANVVIEITVNGVELFHYNMPGTNERQCMWVRRKGNMVRTAQMSSLHAGQLIAFKGLDLWEDWRMDDDEYATIGGGFPISIKGTGIIGSVTCSGLPHEEDHRLLVDSVRSFLGK